MRQHGLRNFVPSAEISDCAIRAQQLRGIAIEVNLIVIGILSLVRGKWLAPLLVATFLAWGAWVIVKHVIPARRYRRHLHEWDEQREREQELISETGLTERELAHILLYHVNYRVSAILRASYPNASWEWTMEDPALFAVTGGTGRIRVYGVLGYDYADVTLDRRANIQCALVQLAPVRRGAYCQG